MAFFEMGGKANRGREAPRPSPPACSTGRQVLQQIANVEVSMRGAPMSCKTIVV